MKETKKFFAEDNRLNKGYSNENNRDSNNNYFRKKFEHILPPADIVAEYENMYEGFVEELITMSKKEQEHRQNMDKIEADINMRLSRTGQFFAVFIVAIISYTTFQLIQNDQLIPGLIFAATGFMAMVISS